MPEKPWWTDETRLEVCAKENRWEDMDELKLLASLRTHNIPVGVYTSYSGREISFESLEKFSVKFDNSNKDDEVIESTTGETSATADNIGQEHVIYENNGKLFLSYSKLLYLVADGKVTEDEMKKGLFFFGCPVQYFEDPENDTIITAVNLAQTEEEKRRLLESYDIMKTVVSIASAEGRTYFKSKDGHLSIRNLNGFLKRNDVDVSALALEEERFSYPTVKQKYNTVVDVVY